MFDHGARVRERHSGIGGVSHAVNDHTVEDISRRHAWRPGREDFHARPRRLQRDRQTQDKRTRRVAVEARDVMGDEQDAHANRVGSDGVARVTVGVRSADEGSGVRRAA